MSGMSSNQTILLTNDDGIESPGLISLSEKLSEIAEVTIVSPSTDQSAIGRTLSNEATVRTTDKAYVVDGTPTDCVLVGLHDLDLNPDIIVSGCNVGPNLGAYGFGRSGTLGAAVEAAYHDIPGIAVSLYVPYEEFSHNIAQHKFVEASRATRYLVEQSLELPIFDSIDYLNLNAPIVSENSCGMKVTRPADTHHVTVTRNEEQVRVRDCSWRHMDESDAPQEGTDHWAVRNRYVSVTPLALPSTVTQPKLLATIANRYPENDTRED